MPGGILIIDDNQSLVGALKEGLETIGFKVAAAYDGLQGVLQAHQGRPEVIMLDFNMPAGGGAGVYDRLRASSDTSSTPIIFLTGVSVAEVKSKIKPTPNTFFLKKPVTVSQLKKVLDKILGAEPGGPKTVSPAAAIPKTETQAPAPVPASPPEASDRGLSRGSAASEAVGAAPPFSVEAMRTPLPGAPPPFAGVGAGASPVKAAAPKAAQSQGKAGEYEMRVPYGDADRFGIVYYGNFLKYFETGRMELFRSVGVQVADLERSILLPVTEAGAEYLAPVPSDSVLRIRSWVSEIGSASLAFKSEAIDASTGQTVARGFSRHAVVDAQWKPSQVPAELKARLQAALIPG